MLRTSKIVAAIFVLSSILPPFASASFEYLPGFNANSENGEITFQDLNFFLPLPNVNSPTSESSKHDLNYNNKLPNNQTSKDDSEDNIIHKKDLTIKKSRKHDSGNRGLRFRFYKESCPRAEKIVNEVISKAYQNNSGVAAGILRLHLHDCFVNGCDASLLLDKTPSNEEVEKLSPANFDLLGTEIIDEVKAQLEKKCPETVSCADILAFGARDSLILSGLPRYKVLGGRRDSLVSRKTDVNGNMPLPNSAIDDILPIFAKKGLNLEDMVVLIGAHSIGIAHCANFAYRVANPEADKNLDPRLVNDVRFTCRNGKITMPIDSSTQYKMDVVFYKQLLNKKGLIESDQKMADDPRTSVIMRTLVSDQEGWYKKFGKSMIKMGKAEVLTGNKGQIRKQCRFVN